MHLILRTTLTAAVAFIALGYLVAGDLHADTYGCFSATIAADQPGGAGVCSTTPQGMLCSLDMTECIISGPTGTGCPNIPGISYDAATNQCIVPPICTSGTYDTTTHDCVVASPGSCQFGTTQDLATGLCTAPPVCSSGAYNAGYQQCIVTSSVDCPSGSTFDGTSGLCIGMLACQAGTYSSTSNMCVDAGGAIVGPPLCPSGLTLNTTSNRCEAAPICSGLIYDAAMKLCVDTTPQTTCFSSSSVVLNTATGLCEGYPDCDQGSGQQFVPSLGACIAHVPATCPPDGTMNTARDRCEAPQGCTSGSTTVTGSLCLDNGPLSATPGCLAGTSLNTSTDVCDTAPTVCTAGTYDPVQMMCVISTVTYATPACPSGMSLDASLDECTSQPAAVSYTFYATVDNQFTLYLDGASILSGSSWGTTYSVTSSLGFGSHVIQIDGINWGNQYGMLFALYDNADGSWPVVSDAGWSNVIADFGVVGVGPWGVPAGWPVMTSQWIWGGGYPSTVSKTFSVPGVCPSGTFDAARSICVAPPICSSGSYDPASKQCAVPATGTLAPSCLAGTTLNNATGRCEVAPACPVNYDYDANSDACLSTYKTCPLGSQYPCQDINGRKMCSALSCINLSTAPVTTVPDPPTASQTNNGAIDPATGQCMGKLVIFPGKPEYCRPPGLATLGTDCCSAAHGGKFSRTEDLDEAIKASVDAYYQNIDASINCTSSTVKIDQRPSGYKAGSETVTEYPVVAGTPVTYYQEIDPQSGPYPRFDYSAVTSDGMTTIQTVIDDKYGTWTTIGCGSPPAFSYGTVYPRELVVNQTYGNYKNDVYVAINDVVSTLTPTCGTTCGAGGQYPDVAHDPYTDLTYVENPLVTMDSSTGVCTVAGNFKDARCQFVCRTAMSGGNIQMTADYVLSSAPYSLVENVAVVAKGPTGTSVSLRMPSQSDCDGFINSGQDVMVIFSNETPALTASTTVNQQGEYANQTMIHTGFLPDLSTVETFQQLFDVLSGAINWYTSPCRPHEQQADIDRDAGKCHTLGSYCISRILGNCTQRKTSYCCFNSKLGRIIQEQGRPQLQAFGPDGGWGVPEAPNCIGLSPEQFQMLDFSKMDLSEFIADIVQPVASDIANTISDRLKNYYSNTQSQATGTAQ